jgi:hypothetical protein
MEGGSLTYVVAAKQFDEMIRQHAQSDMTKDVMSDNG